MKRGQLRKKCEGTQHFFFFTTQRCVTRNCSKYSHATHEFPKLCFQLAVDEKIHACARGYNDVRAKSPPVHRNYEFLSISMRARNYGRAPVTETNCVKDRTETACMTEHHNCSLQVKKATYVARLQS